MKKKLTLILFVLATTFTLNAQTVYHPWILGVSTNYTDFRAIDLKFSDQLTQAEWMGKQLPTMMRVGRMINSSFTLTGVLSTVTLDVNSLNNIPLQKTITSDFFWKVGGQIEYKFANDYLLKEGSWWDPYVFVGLSGSTIQEITYLSFPMGLGMNFWFNEYFGVNVQGSYDYMFDFNDYMHYSGGVVVRFGKMIDKDKDQIPDKYDACPDVFGVAMFQGCPDYDGDGVVDSLDACPKLYGAIESAGCPDQDKDGIPDPEDECPCDPGPAEHKGCPDSDGDGVLDKDDICPHQPGTAATFGCPDRDGDGIADIFDGCPDEPGPKSNGGCPVVKATQQAVVAPIATGNMMDQHEQTIEFDLNSAIILKSSVKSLEEIYKIMQQDPGTNYIINGYSDNTGPRDYNLYLSTERAKAVKEYFVKKGIDSNRLEAFGRGEKNPVSTNNTPEGRALNRRVEIEEK